MTRFARAKGSKSCNERTAEDSTPWEVMKEQLLNAKKDSEDSKKREEAEKQRIENYENFLKEQKVQKRKSKWEDFPESEQDFKKKSKPTKKKSKNVDDLVCNNESKINDNQGLPEKKKKKNKKNKDTSKTEVNEEVTDSIENASDKTKPKNNFPAESSAPKQNGSQANNSSTYDNFEGKRAQNKPNPNQNQGKGQKKNKNKKFADGKPLRRKEVDDNSFQLIIHGKEIELVRYDGFPVMKKDAERLEELRKSMVKKGIPKSEVQRTMKLERRRAEKALARVKREVCYNCRKGGHVLSDCPDLKSKIPGVDAADGICFKCGSTEHKQFECKVQRDKEFRFATCFICKEAGHIARQCPDNPKGLYPNGGSCNLCGDVTHLRKDCPTVNTQKEETSIKLQTLENSDNLEGIGQQKVASVSKDAVKQPKKIKF